MGKKYNKFIKGLTISSIIELVFYLFIIIKLRVSFLHLFILIYKKK